MTMEKITNNIILFNNGATTGFGQDFTQSSIIEITPPLNNQGYYTIDEMNSFGPDYLTWSYTSDFFSHIMSGARRLSNGNTLVTVATDLHIFEINSDGDILWEHQHNPEDQNSISKAFKYSLDYLGSYQVSPGDLNNDQNVNIIDIILMVEFILGNNELSDQEFSSGDINQDGIININDILLTIDIIINQ